MFIHNLLFFICLSFCHLIFIDQIEQLSLRVDNEVDASQQVKDNVVGRYVI